MLQPQSLRWIPKLVSSFPADVSRSTNNPGSPADDDLPVGLQGDSAAVATRPPGLPAAAERGIWLSRRRDPLDQRRTASLTRHHSLAVGLNGDAEQLCVRTERRHPLNAQARRLSAAPAPNAQSTSSAETDAQRRRRICVGRLTA